MAWPTDTNDTTNMDAGTDDPATARADLKNALDLLSSLLTVLNGSTVKPLDYPTITNGTITSLAAALGVAYGGTGSGTAAGSRSNLGAAAASNLPYMVNDGDYPAIDTTLLTIDSSVTEATWETVGPSSSGTDNEWAALDAVTAGANWIKIRITGTILFASGGTPGDTVTVGVAVRTYGSSISLATASQIFNTGTKVDSAGKCLATATQEVTIPVDSSRRFEIYWLRNGSIGTVSILDAVIVGYGYNGS